MTQSVRGEVNYWDIRLPEVNSRPIFGGTLHEWVVLLTPLVLLIVGTMAAFKQPKSPAATALRFGLLPIGVFTSYKAGTFRSFASSPEFNSQNYTTGIAFFWMVVKLVEVTFLQTPPRRRIPSKILGQHAGEVIQGDGEVERGAGRTGEGTLASVREALGYIGDIRLISHDVGSPRCFVAPQTRDIHSRKSFLLATLWSAIAHCLLFDLVQTFIYCIPNTTINTTKGGSIFIDSLSPPARYTLSTVLSICTALVIMAGAGCAHDVLTLVSVGLFNQDPCDYPPLFWKPWAATSLKMFWSQGWHSLFRRTFWIAGGIPGKFVGGNAGAVLGVFFLSGLMHDLMIWGMGRGCDHIRIVGFFMLQAMAILFETCWQTRTQRKVSGVAGWIWTTCFLCASGNLIAEAYLQTGMAGGVHFFNDETSPTRWIAKYVNPTRFQSVQ